MDIVQMAVVLAFGLALASKLDELIAERPDFKIQMVSTIINFPNAKCSDIVKKSNEIFIQLFNILYINKSKNETLWSWIFFSFSLIFSFGLFLQIFQVTVPLENFLIYNVIVSCFFTVGFPTYLFIKKIKSKFHRILFIISILILVNYIEKLYGGGLIAYVFPDNVDINNIYGIILISILIASGVFMVCIVFLYKTNSHLLDVFPIRVIITSFLAIIFITLLKKDIMPSFISDYNEIGIIVLGYLFLNIFADSISLLETDIVLRLAAKGNIKRFAVLGLFDIFLSAVIFLAIPLSTGNLDVFLDAMWFKGDHPWLGVLFWSTFSTSIIFWLFLLSVFVLTILQKILKYYVKLNVALPIDKKPITCLYVVAVVVIIPFMFVT